MRRGGGSTGSAAVAVLAVLSLLASTSTARAAERSVRVGPDYFGVNYPLMMTDSDEVRNRQLTAIRRAGIEHVRVAISWRDLEPEEPVDGLHGYDWSRSDYQVEALARHRLRMMPAFLLAPQWATPDEALICRLSRNATAATDRFGDYAAAARALAARYGPGGSFWRERRDLPRRPIRIWQIWNEPNLVSYWCPRPDPAAYAQLFAYASEAIRDAQPRARVITAGLALHNEINRPGRVQQFLSGALAARPDLWKLADGSGVHLFPSGDLSEQLANFAEWRALLTRSGVPRRQPMFATEVGWGLAGPFGIGEAERAQRYRVVTRGLPRSTCNVAMMNAQAWTTSHLGPVWDYAAGIVDAISAAPYPSAVAFRDSVALMRGEGRGRAPMAKLRDCAGMPKLDRDGDGHAEHRDYYPTDPRRWRNPRR